MRAWDELYDLLPRSYAEAVQRTGGQALLIPADPELVERPDEARGGLDALVLTGGSDISAELCGATPHLATKPGSGPRDQSELALGRRSLEVDLLLLGIGRGMQLLNVINGGSLTQHLPDTLAHSNHCSSPGTFDRHEVELTPGSLAARACGGEQISVWSHHHQCIDGLVEDLVVTGRSAPRPGRRGDRDARPDASRPRPPLAPGGGRGQSRLRRPPGGRRELPGPSFRKSNKEMTVEGRLAGKVCVVTGAASGIGAETARVLSEHGAQVAGVDLAERAVGKLSLQADLTDEAQVKEMFAKARARFGKIDVLFNNAGIAPPDDVSVLETDLGAWQRVQNANLLSVFLCCKHGVPHLLDAGGGSVINTASFVAVMGAATSQISYTASKGGVLALSRELGVEFGDRNVRVNALCPGPVSTPLLEELFAKDPEEARRRLVHVPMGRFARPDEIAKAVLFLASDDSSFVTASAFLVDGGISAAYVTPEA